MHIAFLGLGAMGSRMATNLLASGHSVRVWNRTAGAAAPLVALGATRATSPRDAADGVEVVVSMVRDDPASRHVWLHEADGAVHAMRPGAVGIESSTLSVGWVQELSEALAACGVALLDAPVLGSRSQAELRQLIHVVGGDALVVERARAVFSALGTAVHHCGPTGAGATMKLLANALLGIQVSALAELLGVARRRGIDPSVVASVLGQTPVCSPAARAAADAMARRSFSAAFPIDLIEKDFGYLAACVQPGRAPVSTAAREVFERGVAHGLGAENMTAVAKLYDEGET
jgi:3-hydroxyisobutyrate dehydrogenase